MCASVLCLWLFTTWRHQSDWTMITVLHILWQVTVNTGTTTSVQCFHNENSFHTVTLQSCVYVDRSCLFVSQLDVCSSCGLLGRRRITSLPSLHMSAWPLQWHFHLPLQAMTAQQNGHPTAYCEIIIIHQKQAWPSNNSSIYQNCEIHVAI